MEKKEETTVTNTNNENKATDLRLLLQARNAARAAQAAAERIPTDLNARLATLEAAILQQAAAAAPVPADASAVTAELTAIRASLSEFISEFRDEATELETQIHAVRESVAAAATSTAETLRQQHAVILDRLGEIPEAVARTVVASVAPTSAREIRGINGWILRRLCGGAQCVAKTADGGWSVVAAPGTQAFTAPTFWAAARESRSRMAGYRLQMRINAIKSGLERVESRRRAAAAAGKNN